MLILEIEKKHYQSSMKMEDAYGAVVRDLITGELEAYVAKGTCIATGGYGRVFKTNYKCSYL